MATVMTLQDGSTVRSPNHFRQSRKLYALSHHHAKAKRRRDLGAAWAGAGRGAHSKTKHAYVLNQRTKTNLRSPFLLLRIMMMRFVMGKI